MNSELSTEYGHEDLKKILSDYLREKFVEVIKSQQEEVSHVQDVKNEYNSKQNSQLSTNRKAGLKWIWRELIK